MRVNSKQNIIAGLIAAASLTSCGGGSSNDSSATLLPTVYNPNGTIANSNGIPPQPSSSQIPQSTPTTHVPPASITPPSISTKPNPSPPSIPVSPGQAAQTLLTAITAPTPPASRHLKDMPDEYNDYQAHVVYAVAKGEADRGRDVTTYFTNSITVWNNWLKIESGGRKIKFDVYQDRLDITYVQLPRTDKEYSTFSRKKIEQISADLRDALGGFKQNKKYLVYFEGGRQYDSDYVACGDTELNSQVVVQYLLGDPKGAVCFENRDLAANTFVEPRYLDYIMIHEFIHSEGGVSNNAPNAESNHVNEDERDLMAIRGNFDGWKFLDINKANYYNANGLPPSIYNFATSKFLTPPGSIH